MKEDFIEQLKNHARDVRPSAEWFSVTKQHLASYMRLHPQSTKPAYQATGISWQYIIAPLRSMTRLTPAFIALGAIVIFGTISATAYSSLPGDALYSWKIGINEPVESLFAIGSAQRAQFQVTLVDRRLTEVSEVLAHGGNTGKNSATARVQLEVQTVKARTQIARVASQNNEAALDVAINLDAKLKAHRELIHLLETKTVDDTQTEVRDTISSIEKTSTAIATSIAELEKKRVPEANRLVIDECFEWAREIQKKYPETYRNVRSYYGMVTGHAPKEATKDDFHGEDSALLFLENLRKRLLNPDKV